MLHGGVVSVEGQRADALWLCTHQLHMTSLESDYAIFCPMLDGRMGRERVFWSTPIKTKQKMFCYVIFHILSLSRWFVFLLSESLSKDFFNNSY